MHKMITTFRPIVQGQPQDQILCLNEVLIGKQDFHINWNRKNGAHERTWVINTSTFRMGVFPNAEVRFQIDESATRTSTNNYIGISTLTIGTKIKITDGKGSIPKISFLGTLLIPGSSHSN